MAKVNFRILIITVILFYNAFALATSCHTPVDFIVKCTDGNCGEGFFAYRRYCNSHILDVSENQKTYKFDQKSFSQFNLKTEGFNGFYSLHFDHLGYIIDEKDESIESPLIDFTDEGISFERIDSNAKFEKLNFSKDLSLKQLQSEYAQQSKTASRKERFFNLITGLPILLLIILLHTKWRRRASALRARLLIFTLFAFFLALTFDATFLITPMLVSAGYLTLWSIYYLGDRIFRKIRLRST